MAKLLIVEDDTTLGKAMVDELTEAGFEVVWAKEANEAFTKLKEGKINLIYLDIMLPGELDGYEILRKLKQDGSEYKNIPVVMLSNLGQMKEIDRAMEIGASDYVVKANIDLSRLVELTKSKTALSQ